MNFLKNVLSSLVALFVFFGVGVVLFFIVVGALSQEEAVVLKENSILHLKLNKPISELEVDNPLDELGISESSSIGLIELIGALEEAKDDEKIKGIYLEAPYLIAGLGSTQQIREALLEFKESGKFVVAYGEYFSEAGYYLSSVADKVYALPEGDIEFNGLNANVTFFKGFFDKMEIEPQVFRVGDFKSFVEPYLRKDMSEANRLQLTTLLNSIYDTVLKEVSLSREVDLDVLTNISEKMLVRNPGDAVTHKLVDALYYEDEVMADLAERVDEENPDDLNFISYGKYQKTYSSYSKSKNEIAVIVASGDIVSGKGEANNIGSKKFNEEIRKARADDEIKAVVIRINSPGGSFVASDVMWREIMLTKAEKPVIASMSDVAASGGYYMAMACDTIVAQPNTITGSIGIFSILFNLEGFLNNKLGITNDEVQTGEISQLYNISRPLTDQEKRIIQKDTEDGYETFTTKAAQGRGMSVEDLKKVASGRVWSGNQALDNGLVDILGNLNEAISIAAAKADVSDDYKVRYYPKKKSFFEQILSDLEGDSKAKFVKSELGDLYPLVEKAKKIKNLQGRQTKMAFELEIY